jgi:hypothetical protein
MKYPSLLQKLNCVTLVLAASFCFLACQKEELTVSDRPTSESNFTGPEYQLLNLEALANPSITEASETGEFRILPAEQETADRATPDAESLPYILGRLQLSERQRKAVSGFISQNRGCVADHHQKVRELHQELMKRANARRDEYLRAYQAGRISRSELGEKLNNLNARVREELQNQQSRQRLLRSIYACRKELEDNITSILDREQLQKWNRWKNSLG